MRLLLSGSLAGVFQLMPVNNPLQVLDIFLGPSFLVAGFAGKGAVAVAYLEKAQTEEANPS